MLMPARFTRMARRTAIIAVLLAATALAPLAQGLPDDVADETWSPNGRVNAIVQVGNVVVIGGDFTEVREDGGAGRARWRGATSPPSTRPPAPRSRAGTRSSTPRSSR